MEHIILYERDSALTLPTSPLHENIERSLRQSRRRQYQHQRHIQQQGQTDSRLHPNQPKLPL